MADGTKTITTQAGRWRGGGVIGAGSRLGRGAVSYGIPFLIFLVGWQLFSDAFGVPELFPPPTKTFSTFQSLLADGSLVSDAAASMARE